MIDTELLFSTDIPLISIISAGVALVAAKLIALLLLPRLILLRRHANKCDQAMTEDESSNDESQFPPVSVVVYAQASGGNLGTLLESILTQDYPAPFEVIVANDLATGVSDLTDSVVSGLEMKYQNLYMTFVPERSRNLSRRKLALTLGIKAARYDMMAFTTGDCRIESDKWLRAMMRNVTAGKEVVIGWAYSGNDLSLLDSFDCQRDALRWLIRGIRKKPYRGTVCNLVYSRRLFFSCKGFSDSLNLNYGDDDIFIRSIASRDNSAVELSQDSMVQWISNDPAREYDHESMVRRFTSRFLPKMPYVAMDSLTLCWWVWLGATVVTIVTGLPGLIPAIAMILLAAALLTPVMILWRRVSKVLHLRSALGLMPWIWLWHPVYALRRRMRWHKHRHSHYTWG